MMLNHLTNLLAQNEIPMPESSVKHEGDYWFPVQASEFAGEVDFLYYAIFWICVVFFAGIVGVMCYFCWKYRRIGGLKGEIVTEKSSSHNTALEIFWSVIPSVILVWIFWVGAKGYFEMRVPTDDCEEIYVKAQKWNWSFTYPNGDMTTELHLVMDKPVKLIMESPDVLHSFFVPAFRQKMDIVPGRYSYAYINPTIPGEYRLACTEYCGDGHSRMRTTCVVHKNEEDRLNNTMWITSDHKPWENGERLYKMHCSGCHRVDGQAATGPALNDIWGKDETVVRNGKTETVKVDLEYVTESILYPGVALVEGYSNQMQAFEGKLNNEDIQQIVAFLKWKKDPDKFGDDASVVGGGEEGTEPTDGDGEETPNDENTPDENAGDEEETGEETPEPATAEGN